MYWNVYKDLNQLATLKNFDGFKFFILFMQLTSTYKNVLFRLNGTKRCIILQYSGDLNTGNLVWYSDHHLNTGPVFNRHLNTGQVEVHYSDVSVIHMIVIQIPTVLVI